MQPLPRHRIKGSPLRLTLARHLRHRRTGQHPFARGMRHLRMTIRPTRFRRLRQRNEKCRLRHRQPFRLLAEIREARGPHPFQIAAIRRVGEIEFEDRLLVDAALDLDGASKLQELCRKRPRLARLDQPRHLHGKRRGTGDDPAIGEKLECCATDRKRINAAMLVETPVFVAD
ncbi:hypothetical protein D3C73_660400 [compost metagenome]